MPPKSNSRHVVGNITTKTNVMNNNRIPKSHWSRYFSFVKYITLRKILNLVRSLYFWRVGKEFISTKPSFLKVEISRYCTINYLYCCDKREKVFYSFDLYKNLINQLKDYLFLVSLYVILSLMVSQTRYTRFGLVSESNILVKYHLNIFDPIRPSF